MGEPPEGFGGERPEMPEGADGHFPGEPPEGFDGERPEMPGQPGGQFPGQPGGQFPGQETASGELTAEFVMEDTVNGFSGVSDLTE